jgi:hypothetical protein
MDESVDNDAIERGHEAVTTSAAVIAKGFAVLFAVVAVSLLLMAGLMLLLAKIEGGHATVDAPVPSTERAAGIPRLDSDQSGSLRTLRARETRVLTEYEWVDANAGIARIPIKRAMELMSERMSSTQQPSKDGQAKP